MFGWIVAILLFVVFACACYVILGGVLVSFALVAQLKDRTGHFLALLIGALIDIVLFLAFATIFAGLRPQMLKPMPFEKIGEYCLRMLVLVFPGLFGAWVTSERMD